MALEDFGLCEDQNNSDPFVTVLAGDGKIRVITRVSRDAITDENNRLITVDLADLEGEDNRTT